MDPVRFGTTDLVVSRIGFGCARLGGFLQQSTRSDIVKTLRIALDNGITFYDTADMYCQGESEKLLGEAFRSTRDRVVIASKGGYQLPAQRKIAAVIKPGLRVIARRLNIKRKHLPSSVTGKLSQNFSPSYIRNAVEGSLRRLRTDRIDLYQLHSPPQDVLESGEWIAILEELRTQGKIRYFGVSCETPADVRLSVNAAGLSSVQLGVGVLDPGPIASAIPEAVQRGKAVIARGCFGGGFLSPNHDPDSLRHLTPKWPVVLAMRELSERYRRMPLEMALQFVLSVEGVTVTLLGMRTERQLRENLEYASAPALSDEEFGALLGVSAR